jgi:hypothetical protein
MSLFPLKNILWHPHQKLWNARLVKILRSLTKNQTKITPLIRFIIFIDTVIWQLKTGMSNFFFKKPVLLAPFTLNYFDLGTHQNARELIFFATPWYHGILYTLFVSNLAIF